jgi:outer membrane protein assembly factor BamB
MTSLTPPPTYPATPAPTSTPLTGAGGWPLSIFSGRDIEPVFGLDGTAYVMAGMRDAEGNYQQSLVALDAAGYTKPGWPLEEPQRSDFGWLAMSPDGSVYVGECASPGVGCLVHRLGPDGRELPGWPSQLPPGFSCLAGGYCFNRLEFGPNGTAYLSLWRQVGGLQVIAIDASGGIVPGWPVVPDAQGMWWLNAHVASDGTLFILGLPDGSDSPASLAAFAPDGRPRPGWPVTVPDQSDYLLGPHGTVVVWSLIDLAGELCQEPRRTLFTVLGPDGRTLPGWPRGSTGYASSPVVGADGAIYYVSALGNVYAHDQRGDVKAGWPVAVPGASVSCGPTTPYLAPDGTIYILVDDYLMGSEVTARSPDGRSRPGWPYRPAGQLSRPTSGDTDGLPSPEPPAFGPDGTVYLVVFDTDATGVQAEVVALDSNGQLKPGWPYRLPFNPTAGVAPSLSVSPDGRLFVWRGYSEDSFLLALDPDGSVSD